MSAAAESIPVVLVTGFLGAGKTTLVNRLLTDPAFADTAVVVNEFGAVDVDGDLLRMAAGDLLATSTGCLCCMTSADVRTALFDLHETAGARLSRTFSQVIVETTGLADPAPVINMLTPGALPAFGLRDHTVARRFHLAGVVALVDAVTGDIALDRHLEAVRQVAFADRILLTKTDLLTDPASRRDLRDLRDRLAGINPAAPILDGAAELRLETLFRARYAPDRCGADAEGWLAIDRLTRERPASGGHPVRSTAHGDDLATVVLRHEGPVARAAIDVFLTLLQNAAGAEVLRVKGLAALTDAPERPAVVHMVRHLVHPVVQLEAWPGPDRGCRIVVIGRGLVAERLQFLFDALVARSDGQARHGTRTEPLPIAMAAVALLAALLAFTLAPPSQTAADPVGSPAFKETTP